MNSSIIKTTSSGAHRISSGLGWFSLILGLIGLLAPRRAARAIGVRNHPLLFRLIGLREVATGIGILSSTPEQRNARAGWFWSRVGGDAVDLAVLGFALTRFRFRRSRLGLATGAVAGITVLDTIWALLHTPATPIHVRKSITVNREPADLYNTWRDLNNLPRFMTNLESVTLIDSTHSHWVAKSPVGTPVEWDAEISEDIPNEKIAWRSTADAEVAHAGAVEFKPASEGRGTVVQVTLDYEPPAGKIGNLAAKAASIFGRAPEQQMETDLHRFEQWMETGSITTTEGQPTGSSYREFSTNRAL